MEDLLSLLFPYVVGSCLSDLVAEIFFGVILDCLDISSGSFTLLVLHTLGVVILLSFTWAFIVLSGAKCMRFLASLYPIVNTLNLELSTVNRIVKLDPACPRRCDPLSGHD